jgi:NAD(P)-dependent dehydrogenase (short-subunit alcohol dehydrogenase family)
MSGTGTGTGLEGRVALVTGGGRGIGKAIALGIAASGADVAVNYRRDDDAARATVKEIEAVGRRAQAYAASVDDYSQCETMVASVLDDFGKVDILVNNAGVASRGQSVADTEPAEIDRLLRTHAVSAWACSKLVLPSMRAQERGDIVMISSVAAVQLPGWSAPYNMAKAALEALAYTLAKEERRNGVHVNVVAPGLVDTEMGRRLVKGAMGVEDIRTMDDRSAFGHVCTPEEVADAVCWVVSERASYVTGQRIGVDGGGF